MTIRTAENIFLVAGGPSAKGLGFQKLVGKGFILGVKEAFFHAPCNACFTMDRRWNMYRLRRLEAMRAQVFASVKHWSFKSKHGAKDAGPDPWPEVERFKVWVDRNGLSDEPGVLNGKNSGFAALNLVYQFNPKRIFLFGYDLSMQEGGPEYWYPGHEWRAAKKRYGQAENWIPDHSLAAKQCQLKGIQVYNVSKQSAIECYPKISFEKTLKMLEAA